MELTLKWIDITLSFTFLHLCNGKPINFEDTFIVDNPNNLITGLVILLTVCSLIFIGGCLCCTRNNGPKRFRDSPVVASVAPDFDHGHVNPVANGEFTIFTPLSPHLNNNIFLASEQIASRTFENHTYDGFDLSPWFNDQERDFPRIKLKYIKELGRGWFGKVVQGAAQDIGDNGQLWTPVVVRILDATSSQKEKVLFLQDASIYKCGSHPNILTLIGRCLDTVPFLLLQEYCPQGDLKAYLRANRGNAEKLLSGDFPLIWCCQLTSALKHLHNAKLCHPDLAARNCHLTSDLTLKLGDYGLGVHKYPGDYYQSQPGVPVRWCAPESLNCTQTTIQPRSVTPEGNVWALGVTMWEIYECGDQPYARLTDDEVIAQVLGPPQVRLERPRCSVLYTDYIFRLMQLCWLTNAEERPTITRIDLMLSDLLQVQKNANNTNSADSSLSVDDFDRRWETFKPNYIVKTDHLLDSVSVEIHETGMNKRSPSLTNLHGSLDDLLVEKRPAAECFIEDEIAQTKVPADANSNSDSDREEFRSKQMLSRNPFIDGFSIHRMSSGSETEEENWRHKVERGAYTEKVRMKSRSVADLMVLTHVDYSESESETPLPSLDYRVNYKNVRLAPANNLESANITFGSEGNLLSVKDTFQEELKKLREERRDSLLFVPDNYSIKNDDDVVSTDLIHDLNNTAELKPANQVYNVFNVTIEHSPIHVNKKLNDIIFNDCSNINFGKQSKILPMEACINEKDISNSNLADPSNMNDSSCLRFDHLNGTDTEEETDSIRTLSGKLVDEILSEAKHTVEKNSFPLKEIQNLSGVMLHNGNSHREQTDGNPFKSETHSASTGLAGKSSNVLSEPIDTGQQPELPCNESVMERAVSQFPERLSNDKDSDSVVNSGNMSLESPSVDEKRLDGGSNNEDLPPVLFDTSNNQQQAMPNSLTHSNLFCSTPFRKKDISLPCEDVYTSMTFFKDEEEQSIDNPDADDKELNYSLETWDNFLGKALDQSENLFDSFSSEPQSLLFIDDKNVTYDKGQEKPCREDDGTTFDVQTKSDEIPADTEQITAVGDATFVKDAPEDSRDSWESGGGWFLHPQTSNECPSGELQMQPTTTDSYVGFGIDDEIMSAIRNELLSKLPHAQGASSERVKDEDEWDECERNEVFLKYNVYNTPLSPIPEESYVEELSGLDSPKRENEENIESDWSERCEAEALPQDTVSNSPHTNESLCNRPLHRHTPSQDSCCSNDTLFNLEELICAEKEGDSHAKNDRGVSTERSESDLVNTTYVVNNVEEEISEESTLNCKMPLNTENSNERSLIEIFLTEEKDNSSRLLAEPVRRSEGNTLPFPVVQAVPLPSPEDNPWKQLPASLLNYDKVISTNSPFALESKQVPEFLDVEKENSANEILPDTHNENEDVRNVNEYEEFVNMENAKNSLEYSNLSETNEYICERTENDNSDDETIYGILTDIRFNGPSDSQLMSTSFSESNNCDDQEWDSGSESRSSSSGEFIWKEGEHEESLKALRAAPQDVMDDIKPMDSIPENTNEESDISSTFTDDEDGETPEFVPSAWDKFAMPGKSALRSPEKLSKNSEEKKSKAVWFKKQKYQCVYEYPKEPESPVSQAQDLWKTPPHADYSSFIDDPSLDDEFFITSTTRPFDLRGGQGSQFFPGNSSWMENATPDSGLEDMTPRDDRTFAESVPALKRLASDALNRKRQLEKNRESLGDLRHQRNKLKLDLPPSPSAFTSEKLFTIDPPSLEPVVREKPTFTTFGKSRFHVQHVDTPSDDTESKDVSFEALPYQPLQEIHLKDNETEFKNLQHFIKDENSDVCNLKMEMVRGEASLLDSADEDSGIESTSTLERKLSAT